VNPPLLLQSLVPTSSRGRGHRDDQQRAPARTDRLDGDGLACGKRHYHQQNGHGGGGLATSRGRSAIGQGHTGETKDHQDERLQAIRLRYTINTHLEDRRITTPATIGAATG
jgi:hypothetical protein